MSAEEVIYCLDQPFKVVRKTQRRSLVIKLHPDKENQILANKSVSQKVISDFLLSKKDWLQKNLQKIEAYRSTYNIPEFKEGQLFPFFGEMKYFKIVKTPLKRIRFVAEEGFLICYQPTEKEADPKLAKKLQIELVRFYKREAAQYLIQRTQFLSRMVGLIPKQIKIQTARTRWGSCNSQQVINLNWKLIVFPYTLIDYVIIHELCHLRYLDHSPAFWDLVADHCPNYKDIQANLKQQTTQAAFLDSIHFS